jgi:hypothetical protein
MPQVATDTQEFKQCLKDAYKLVNQYFSPELDNLHDESIGSVLFKVITEWDLYDERQPQFDSVPRRSGEAWKKKVIVFMQKWRDKVEVDSERSMYNIF